MQVGAVEDMEVTDPQLVDRARQGDQSAFGDLIQRHWRKCVALGCFFLRNQGDAEDVAQNAVMKAYKHLDQYQGGAEFSTWLARIVANECLMLMRVHRRTRFVYLDDAPSETRSLALQLAGQGPDPEGAFGYAQLTQVLRFEVGRIPKLMRNVMLLRDIRGLSLAEVAEQLGITVSAAKSRLVRARAELCRRMVGHCSRAANSPALSRVAAPLNRVGRHGAMQAAE